MSCFQASWSRLGCWLSTVRSWGTERKCIPGLVTTTSQGEDAESPEERNSINLNVPDVRIQPTLEHPHYKQLKLLINEQKLEIIKQPNCGENCKDNKLLHEEKLETIEQPNCDEEGKRKESSVSLVTQRTISGKSVSLLKENDLECLPSSLQGRIKKKILLYQSFWTTFIIKSH